MKKVIISIAILYCNIIYCQVGIGTTNPNTSSVLDITSTSKGLLLPRLNLVSTTNFAPLLNHVAGMMVYNLATLNDVKPGYYLNDGSKWQSVTDAIQKTTEQQTAIDDLKTQVPIKRAVFVAGQSNTLRGRGRAIIPDFSGKNLFQLGRSTANLQILPLTFYNDYHHNFGDVNYNDCGSFGSVFLNYYYNKLKLEYPNREVQLLLIHCGAGSSGWAASQYPNNSWRTDDKYFTDLVTRIKWAKNNGYQIDAFLWHQGETDAQNQTINYKDLLKNFIQSVRDHAGNQKLPFILGELSQSWVASNAGYPAYQGIINSIPNEVPYTATTSSTGLSLDADVVHFDAQSHVELGLRYFNKLDIAKTNATPSAYTTPTVGQNLVYNFNAATGLFFPDIFSAIRFGTSSTDARYSVLGDIWKYKNQDGYYRFKLEVVSGTGISGGVFEWKQKINPFGLVMNNFEDRSSCTILSNTIGLNATISGQGFSSLVYNSGSASTLLHGDYISPDWFFPVGQIVSFGNRIPLLRTNLDVFHVRLYCVKE